MTDKKIFVFNGCSQTSGREVIKEKPDALDDETREFTWAKHLQMNINPSGEYINLARSGASNDSIFRHTIEWLAANPDKHQDVLIVVMWTEPNRFEFETKDGYGRDYIAASSVFRDSEDRYINKFVNEHLSNKELSRSKTLNMMLSLEGILTMLGIKFIFLNGFNHIQFYNAFLLPQTDFSKLSNLKYKSAFLKDQYCLFNVLNNNFKSTKSLHFYEDAHKYYADYIFERLDELI